MEGGRETPERRRTEIGSRLVEIRARIKELGDERTAGVAAAAERLAAAERGAAASLAAAEQAFASSVQAFRRAAEAHEHLVGIYERSAGSGAVRSNEYKRLADHHRAAAAADRQRAEEAQQRADANKAAKAIVAETGALAQSAGPRLVEFRPPVSERSSSGSSDRHT